MLTPTPWGIHVVPHHTHRIEDRTHVMHRHPHRPRRDRVSNGAVPALAGTMILASLAAGSPSQPPLACPDSIRRWQSAAVFCSRMVPGQLGNAATGDAPEHNDPGPGEPLQDPPLRRGSGVGLRLRSFLFPRP